MYTVHRHSFFWVFDEVFYPFFVLTDSRRLSVCQFHYPNHLFLLLFQIPDLLPLRILPEIHVFLILRLRLKKRSLSSLHGIFFLFHLRVDQPLGGPILETKLAKKSDQHRSLRVSDVNATIMTHILCNFCDPTVKNKYFSGKKSENHPEQYLQLSVCFQ